MKQSLREIAAHCVPHSVFLIIIVGLSCGWKERVPSDSEIRSQEFLSPFLVEAMNITGVYQNLDMDSVLFVYSTSIANSNEFWDRVTAEAKSSGWIQLTDTREGKRFERIRSRQGGRMYGSAEEIRIHYNANGGRVVVAWVQGDPRDTPEHFESTSEARWAERVVWPKFESLCCG